jgi:glutaconate CoA-transferase subunit B
MHPGITRDQVIGATGWPVRFAADVSETAAPSDAELDVLRRLRLETKNAHKTKEPA